MYPQFTLLFLINAHQEILLLRRINTPFCNQCYSLPGGTIEQGETARTALVREAKNSLCLAIAIDDLEFVHVMYRKCNEPEFFASVFKLSADQQEPQNGESERHDDMRWFSLHALPDNMVPAHRHAIEMIHKKVLYSEHGWEKLF